jgi:hypothetical protein
VILLDKVAEMVPVEVTSIGGAEESAGMTIPEL